MSTEITQTSPGRTEWADDEIDLRRYLAVLGRRWVEILLITLAVVVLAAAGVLIYRYLSIPTYEAAATAAIVRTSTDVKFDERFTTTADQPGSSDNASRRASLVGLVSSGAIAEQVIAALGDTLSEEERNPAVLLQMVDGELGGINGRSGQSDLITIRVAANTPEKAAAIANAWATAYVEEVNRIYGQVPAEMVTSVEAELSGAQAAYAAAQASVEAFLAESQLQSLARQAEEKQKTIDELEDSRIGLLATYVGELQASYQRIVKAYLDAQTANQLLAFDKEQEGQRALLSSYLDAYNSARVDTFTAQNDRDRAQLRLLYDQWLQTTAHLATARTLASQLEAGGEGAVDGTGVALQLLKMQLVTDGARLPVTMGELYQPAAQLANPASTTPQFQVVDGGTGDDTEAPTSVNQIVVGGAATPQQGRNTASTIQLQVDPPATTATRAELEADLTGLVQSLEGRLAETESTIAALEQTLLAGNDFSGLDGDQLAGSELAKAIEAQYPQLFQSGAFSALSAEAAADGGLATAGQVQAGQLLALAGIETLPAFNGVDEPMSQAVERLEEEVRAIRAQLEAEQARDLQVKQQRDLTWESYKALSNKLAELNLARAAGDSEVRMGISAVAPTEPVQGTSLLLSLALAGVIGLVLALLVAFIRETTNRPPLFARRHTA